MQNIFGVTSTASQSAYFLIRTGSQPSTGGNLLKLLFLFAWFVFSFWPGILVFASGSRGQTSGPTRPIGPSVYHILSHASTVSSIFCLLPNINKCLVVPFKLATACDGLRLFIATKQAASWHLMATWEVNHLWCLPGVVRYQKFIHWQNDMGNFLCNSH